MVQEKLLTVNKLRTEFFRTKNKCTRSADIGKGEILGLVGELMRKERYLPFDYASFKLYFR